MEYIDRTIKTTVVLTDLQLKNHNELYKICNWLVKNAGLYHGEFGLYQWDMFDIHSRNLISFYGNQGKNLAAMFQLTFR